jgi:hypothetical protein
MERAAMLGEIMWCDAKSKDIEYWMQNCTQYVSQCGVLAMEAEPTTETCGKIVPKC